MALKVTTWSPDTCGCSFDYEWDDEQPQAEREHHFKKVVRECKSHSHLKGNNKKDMFESSLEENRRKNLAIAEFMDKEKDTATTTRTIRGDVVTALNEEIDIQWDWEGKAPNRKLILKVRGYDFDNDPNRKSMLDESLTKRFGRNKVEVIAEKYNLEVLTEEEREKIHLEKKKNK